MALINCPECGTEVSDKAGACPKCAFPIAGIASGAQIQSSTAHNQETAAPVVFMDEVKKNGPVFVSSVEVKLFSRVMATQNISSIIPKSNARKVFWTRVFLVVSSAPFLAVGIEHPGVLIFGLFLLLCAYFYKPVYTIKIVGGGSEMEGLSSTDKALVSRTFTAIEKAISTRH